MKPIGAFLLGSYVYQFFTRIFHRDLRGPFDCQEHLLFKFGCRFLNLVNSTRVNTIPMEMPAAIQTKWVHSKWVGVGAG